MSPSMPFAESALTPPRSTPSDAMPPIWAIGDVQGCHRALQMLLAHPDISNDPDARFWFCGDLVNRGPDSLAALQTVMAMGDRAVTVLGNHDLHLLGVYAGIRGTGKSDTIQAILDAPDADRYIDWLRHQPLAHHEYGHLLVHAGVLPQWTVGKTLELAAEVEHALRSDNWPERLSRMYGNKPRIWDDSLQGHKRLRAIINALTRMRLCTADGHMEFKHKGEPEITGVYMPWFDVPDRKAADTTIVFGHWSALGLLIRPRLLGLDTGCVWGRKLTAVRLHDRKLVQVSCHPGQTLGDTGIATSVSMHPENAAG